MSAPERPRLRPSIDGQLDPQDTSFVFLFDAARVSRHILRLHRQALGILQLFNGERTLRDIQALLLQHGAGLAPLELLQHIAGTLDEACFLEGAKLEARFAEYLQNPVREPACVGSYEAEPEALNAQLRSLFVHEHGPGAPPMNGHIPDGQVRGALIPHIDYRRGGHTYAWGFKELIERSDATIFVIIGTAHYSAKRFTLTKKDFRTPLGIAETDKSYVDRIASIYGNRAYEDEVGAHMTEHSIELQVVLLQHCLNSHRNFRIVPLAVGSFQDCVLTGAPPHEKEDIYLMVQALRRAEADSGEKVCYISSGDLAHIGPKFGDPEPVAEPFLEHSRKQDHSLLHRLAAADRSAFFEHILHEQDRRRICGFPPTYTLLSALEPEQGKLLHYDQYVEPRGFESVSFASLAFYKTN
jgi:AmmeMemoRadiSam system protein B